VINPSKRSFSSFPLVDRSVPFVAVGACGTTIEKATYVFMVTLVI